MWNASYVQNSPVKPDRSSGMTRSEKLCEVNRSTSLLDESNHSDAARSSSIDSGNSDCEKPCKRGKKENKLFENGMVVLGLATSHDQKVKLRRYVGMISPDILPTHE